MSVTALVHQALMSPYSLAAAVESLHHVVTAVRRVSVVKARADAAHPSQVQQSVNMSVVVAASGMSQQRVWSKAEAP